MHLVKRIIFYIKEEADDARSNTLVSEQQHATQRSSHFQNPSQQQMQISSLLGSPNRTGTKQIGSLPHQDQLNASQNSVANSTLSVKNQNSLTFRDERSSFVAHQQQQPHNEYSQFNQQNIQYNQQNVLNIDSIQKLGINRKAFEIYEIENIP